MVDRGRFASLPVDVVDPLDLQVGSEIPGAVFSRLRELADEEAAYRAAVRAQALRPHAREDLRRRLLQKQHLPRAVAGALDRLEGAGLLDDQAFARHFAATRGARGRGPRRLITDLLRQGVDRRAAEEAVQAAFAEEALDPDVTARSVAERRAAQLKSVPLPARRRRLLAYLARRGFVGATVRDMVEDVCRRSTLP
jgi:regulatory protein